MQAQQRILINALVVVGFWTLLRTYFTTLVDFETTESVSNNRSSTSLSIPATSCVRYSNTTGTWNGTEWVPPTGWRIYESNELRTVYRDQTILWMGDSTAARAAILHYGILSKREDLLLDTVYPKKTMDVLQQSSSAACTKRWGPSSMQLQLHGNRIFDPGVRRPLCLPMMPNGSSSPHEFLYMPIECYFMLEGFLRDEIAGRSNVTLDVDVLILGTGIWEVVRTKDCGDAVSGRNRSVSVMQREVILLAVQLASVRPNLRILWRTMGYIDSTSKAVREAHTMGIDQLNKKAIALLEETLLDEKLSCQVSDVDWGGSVRPRSFQKDRIKGDFPPHYGLAARINQLQMVTNTLYGNSTV